MTVYYDFGKSQIDNHFLNTTKTTLQSKYDELLTKYNTLNTNNIELNDINTQNNIIIEQLTADNKRISSENQHLTLNLSNIQHTNNQLETQYIIIIQENNELRSQLMMYETDYTTLQTSSQATTEQLQQEHNDNIQLIEYNTHLYSTLQHSQDLNSEYIEEINTLKHTLECSNKQYIDLKTDSDETINRLQDKLHTYETTLVDITAQNDKYIIDIEVLVEHISDLEYEKSQLLQRMAENESSSLQHESSINQQFAENQATITLLKKSKTLISSSVLDELYQKTMKVQHLEELIDVLEFQLQFIQQKLSSSGGGGGGNGGDTTVTTPSSASSSGHNSDSPPPSSDFHHSDMRGSDEIVVEREIRSAVDDQAYYLPRPISSVAVNAPHQQQASYTGSIVGDHIPAAQQAIHLGERKSSAADSQNKISTVVPYVPNSPQASSNITTEAYFISTPVGYPYPLYAGPSDAPSNMNIVATDVHTTTDTYSETALPSTLAQPSVPNKATHSPSSPTPDLTPHTDTLPRRARTHNITARRSPLPHALTQHTPTTDTYRSSDSHSNTSPFKSLIPHLVDGHSSDPYTPHPTSHRPSSPSKIPRYSNRSSPVDDEFERSLREMGGEFGEGSEAGGSDMMLDLKTCAALPLSIWADPEFGAGTQASSSFATDGGWGELSFRDAFPPSLSPRSSSRQVRYAPQATYQATPSMPPDSRTHAEGMVSDLQRLRDSLRQIEESLPSPSTADHSRSHSSGVDDESHTTTNQSVNRSNTSSSASDIVYTEQSLSHTNYPHEPTTAPGEPQPHGDHTHPDSPTSHHLSTSLSQPLTPPHPNLPYTGAYADDVFYTDSPPLVSLPDFSSGSDRSGRGSDSSSGNGTPHNEYEESTVHYLDGDGDGHSDTTDSLHG